MRQNDHSRNRWDQRYRERGEIFGRSAHILLQQQVESLTPGNALDLGAGEGRNAIWLAERGWSVLAVDFALEGLRRGCRRLIDPGLDLSWLCADATHYPLPAGRYELVILVYLQLPAMQRAMVLQQADRCLRPGGSLIYIAHDLSNLTEGSGGPQDPKVLCQLHDVVDALPGYCIVRAEPWHRNPGEECGHGVQLAGPAIDFIVHAIKN